MKKTYKFMLDFTANPQTSEETVRQWVKEFRSATLVGNIATVDGDDAFALRMRIDPNIMSIEAA